MNHVSRLLVTGTALVAMAACAASASADHIYFTFSNENGTPPASSIPVGGFYNVSFEERLGVAGAVSGAIERGGTVIATAPPFTPVPGTDGGVSRLEATLQPGDVVRLFDPKVAGGSITTTFTGYPTVAEAQCGSATVSGTSAPGQPVVAARYDRGFRTPGEAGGVVNTGGGYTVTFPTPLPPGAIIYLTSQYTQPQPLLEVQIALQARALGSCLPTPSETSTKPGTSTSKCVVPNLKHKTLVQARKLLARARCKLGEVKTSKKHKHRKLVVVSQRPAAKRTIAAGTKVNVRLG